MSIDTRSRSRRPAEVPRRQRLWWAVVLGLAIGGCADEPEPPSVGQASTREPGLREFDDVIVLGPADVGDTIFATGWVANDPVDGGFFLRTEGERVVYVDADLDVSWEAPIQVTGVVRTADPPTLAAREVTAFGREVERAWRVEREYYLEATAVVPFVPGSSTTSEGDAPDSALTRDSAGARR